MRQVRTNKGNVKSALKVGALKKRILLSFLFIVLGGLSTATASNAAGSPGVESAASASNQRLEGASLVATGPARATASGANASGRRKKPRLMPLWLAQNNAIDMAEYLYTDPEANWTDYGIGKCTRFSRSRVSCYSYVVEDYYDSYGLYSDTMLCDWFTTSYYPRYGRAKVVTSYPDCVWMSEI